MFGRNWLLEYRINRLIKALWGNDAAKAIASLKAIGEPALPALLVALKKDDRNAELIEWENGALRDAIIALGEPAFTALVQALSPGSGMARAAAKTLRRWGDPRAVDYLIAAMLDRNLEINGRCYVIDAVAAFRDLKAREPLERLLSERNEYIRSHAARAIAEYGDASTLPGIFKALRDVDPWYWSGTRESIEEILKTLEDRYAQEGRDAEFAEWLQKMNREYPDMVSQYKVWRIRLTSKPIPAK